MYMRMLLSLSLPAVLAVPLTASPPGPPPPDEYDVIIRYRIDAARNERVTQFREMMRYLESIGFDKDPSENENEVEDRTATEMTGHIKAADARKILLEPHIRTIMLYAKGAKLPADVEQFVRVDLGLTANLEERLQHNLYNQTRDVLRTLGFQEGVGYDNRGGTRIVGNIAAKNLLRLLEDLRDTPAGTKMPSPFDAVTPIRLVDVQLGRDLVRPLAALPELPLNQAKIAPELRAVLAARDGGARPLRLDVILWRTPEASEQRWIQLLQQAAPTLIIEGRLGPVVSVLVPSDRAGALADLPIVSGVRLPRLADSYAGASGLDQLPKLNRGARIAVISGDFTGYAGMVKAGRLPAGTRLVDMTAQRSPDILPDPPAKGADMADGTRLALAVAKAAPNAGIVLVRVDPAAPFMVEEAIRTIDGEKFLTTSLDHRAAELTAEDKRLNERREKLLMERRVLLEANLPIDDFQPQWDEYVKRQEAFNKEERAYDLRAHRFLDLRDAVNSLKGVQVIVSGLLWNDGYPIGGSSGLGRFILDRPKNSAPWIQAAGDAGRQTWTGLFRDADGNGAMEFAAPGAPLAKNAWTSELNFLGRGNGKTVDELPAGAKVRVTLQWREVHDPDFMLYNDDVYRTPLAPLRVLVLRQRDPQGKKLDGDDMEVIAQSDRLPERIDNQPNSSIYEQTVEFTTPAAGRYAVMVLGRAPAGIRPADRAVVPSATRTGELHPRLFVNGTAGDGKPVFLDYNNAARRD
jgi:hypothetical protein